MSSSLSFTPLVQLSSDGTRTAQLSIPRGMTIATPGLLACSSRGVIPHLSRDNVKRTSCIKWAHIPFETFLENKPPVPTLQPGDTPLASFIGFPPEYYLISMSLRDPADGREMPANTNPYVTANCIRGVRRVTPNDWRSYIKACNPDIAFSLSDIPFTAPPYSQKRLTKSIERSALWLSHLLQPEFRPPNVFVQMAGGASAPARSAFSSGLLEPLQGKEAEAIRPLKCLDEGVAGYVFDMVPLRLALQDRAHESSVITSLIQASLSALPSSKPRLATTVQGPHETLRLIRDVGIDLFDTHWAQHAADIGVALDFVFPINASSSTEKRDLGHNLYDVKYRSDFSSFADSLRAGNTTVPSSTSSADLICSCAACSPISSGTAIRHSSVDRQSAVETACNPPYTRAFIHHLLHTHEMSAHSLLAMHNLTVMEAFFAGIRQVVGRGDADAFRAEVDRFCEAYDGEEMRVFEDAKVVWEEVTLLRGKGRLARERKKEEEAAMREMKEKDAEGGEAAALIPVENDATTLGTAVEL